MLSITLIIIGITGLISYKGFNEPQFFEKYLHHPYTEARNGEYIRMLSSGFLHGSQMHLIVNLYVFYIFGSYVESAFYAYFGTVKGGIFYVLFYLLAIIAADIPSYLTHKDNPRFSSIGASGAVSAITFSFIFFEPWNILLLFFVIPIPAIIFGILYLFYSSYAAKNNNDKIDHLGHFGGAVFGIIATLILFSSHIPVFIEKILKGPDLSFLGM